MALKDFLFIEKNGGGGHTVVPLKPKQTKKDKKFTTAVVLGSYPDIYHPSRPAASLYWFRKKLSAKGSLELSTLHPLS
jgi:hypothetical protein